MKKILTSIAFLFFFFIVQGQNQDSIAVSKIIGSFIDAFNRKDVKLFSSLFAEDAEFYNWQGSFVRGRQQIEDFHVGVFKRLGATQLKVLSYSIRFIKPDVATAIINEENTNMASTDGKPLPNRIVNLVWVLTKEDSSWLIKMNHTAMLNDGSKITTKN